MAAPRHPAAWFVSRGLLAILLGIVLALGVDVVRTGGPRLWLARHGIPMPYVGQGRPVDIGGRSLYVDCRGTRPDATTPTVVFVSGMGDGAGGWSSVHDEIAATTRACTYDRAGIGRSDPGPRHTLVDAATDLRMLLSAAGESAPFVVVGHSLGVDHTRVFASMHLAEVDGIVLVDGFSSDHQTDWVHPLLGPLRGEYEERLDGLRALVDSVEDLDWATSEEQLRATDLRGLPVAILRAARAEPRLDAATNEAIEAAVVAGFEVWSPGNVTYELAYGAGHVIQVDRPDLVVATVRRMIDTARAASGQQASLGRR